MKPKNECRDCRFCPAHTHLLQEKLDAERAYKHEHARAEDNIRRKRVGAEVTSGIIAAQEHELSVAGDRIRQLEDEILRLKEKS